MGMRAAATLLLGLAVLAAGCGSDEDTVTSAVSLENQPWVLVSGADMPADLAGAAPGATLMEETVAGSTGCNRYTGGYSYDGESLEFSNISATEAACASPADAIERSYLDALGQVAAWRAEDETLVLVGADDAELLRFEAATPVGTWHLTGLVRGDAFTAPVSGTDVTAVFAAGGALSGSAGCNTYTAEYTFDMAALEMSPPNATRKACATPAGVMDQETAYLELLPKVTRFNVGGGALELLGDDGTRLATFAAERP